MPHPTSFCAQTPRVLSAMALLLGAVQASAAPSKLVVFGDSLSDNGNASAWFDDVGIELPAPPYAEGRFSNGPVAVEVMAARLGLTLEDHAFGGALTGEDNRLTQGPILAGTGVQGQIKDFLDDAGGTTDGAALYVVWGGANDLLESATPESATAALDNMVANVTLLYEAGARQFFVPNLPDLGTTASAIAAGGAQQANAHAVSVSFNSALAQAMGGLQGRLPGAQIQVFDTFATLAGLRADYVAQGFNVTQACWDGDMLGEGTACADPSRYFLWDSEHPSAGVHQVLGEAFAQAVPEPAAWALSVAGVVMVGALARRRARQPSAA